MNLKMALAGVLVAGFVVPAVAQTATSFWVVQDVKTKKCTIVDKKPMAGMAGMEYTVVGDDGTVYKTRTEAETAMKTVKVCTTN